jgi:hypothetical protein
MAARQGHEIASHSATHAPMAGLLSDIGPVFKGILSAPDRFAHIRQIILRMFALYSYPKSAKNVQSFIDPLLEPRVSRQEIQQHLPDCQVLSYSYPGGRLNAAARQAVAAAGYLSARGNQAGINNGFDSPFALCDLCHGPGLTLTEMEPWMLQTIDQGGWLILTFHLVSKSNPAQYPYTCSVLDFRQIIKRLQKLPFWIATQQAVVAYLGKNTPQ